MKKIIVLLSVILFTNLAWAGSLGTSSSANILINSSANAKVIVPSGDSTMVPTSGATFTGSVVLAADPISALQAATKQYVDNLAGGLIPIGGTVVATTANLTATYANGAAGVGATLTNSGTLAAISIDGVALASTDRVLVKNQTAPEENGVYSVTTVGSGAVAWVLTRATDYDSALEIKPGTLVSVTSGTVNSGSSFYETATVVTVGTDPIDFSVFFSPAGYLQKANNLSDLASVSIARSNLGLGTAAVQNVGFFAQVANNLSDLTNAVLARTNLGLGSIATHPTTDFISSAGTVVANDIVTFTNTSGNAVKDSGIIAANYGAINNLFIGISAGNPSIGTATRDIGIGASALSEETDGGDNVAIGWSVSGNSTTARQNTLIGNTVGDEDVDGVGNAVLGYGAWELAETGNLNTAVGAIALANVVSGGYNVALGQASGFNYTGAESSNVDINNLGVLGESHVMHLGTVGSGSGQINTAYWGNVNIPLSTSINTILYNSAANTVAQIAAVNNAIVITDGTGVPSESATLPLINGGAAASLAGGSTGQLLQRAASTIGYTTATYPATAAGVGTILRANGTNWLASTATYPNTFSINDIPYASAANVLGSISAAANSILAYNGSSVPAATQTLPTAVQTNITSLGTIGSSSVIPNAALVNSSIILTAGAGISVSGSPVALGGTATITNSAPSITWVAAASGPNGVMTVNRGYSMDGIGVASTFIFPTTCPLGSEIKMSSHDTSGAGWSITLQTGQRAYFNDQISSSAGAIAGDRNSSADMVCFSNNTIVIQNANGNITLS